MQIKHESFLEYLCNLGYVNDSTPAWNFWPPKAASSSTVTTYQIYIFTHSIWTTTVRVETGETRKFWHRVFGRVDESFHFWKKYILYLSVATFT